MYEGSVNLPPCTPCCLEVDKSGISGQGKVESLQASARLATLLSGFLAVSVSQKHSPHHPKSELINCYSGSQSCSVSGDSEHVIGVPLSHKYSWVLGSLCAAMLCYSLQSGLRRHKGALFSFVRARVSIAYVGFNPKSVPAPSLLECLRRGGTGGGGNNVMAAPCGKCSTPGTSYL